MKKISEHINMYIGHYKAVNSTNEFFSEARTYLDFPTQVEYKKKRYSLIRTHIVSTEKQLKNLKSRAKELDIKFDVKI